MFVSIQLYYANYSCKLHWNSLKYFNKSVRTIASKEIVSPWKVFLEKTSDICQMKFLILILNRKKIKFIYE